jgi:hypothetical protein
MLDALRRDQADLVVATRYALGADVGPLASWRGKLSRIATDLTRWVLDIGISDPMSGFFALRREAFDALAPNLSNQGFKILLDILATSRGGLRIKELPFVFRARQHGESKLNAQVGLDFLGLLVTKVTHDLVPLRFLSFALVGLIGVAVHFTVLFPAIWAFAVPFTAAQIAASFVAMTSNLTHLSGAPAAWHRGLKGISAVLYHLFARCGEQSRYRQLDLRGQRAMVARRSGRIGRRVGVELHNVDGVDLARALSASLDAAI